MEKGRGTVWEPPGHCSLQNELPMGDSLMLQEKGNRGQGSRALQHEDVIFQAAAKGNFGEPQDKGVIQRPGNDAPIPWELPLPYSREL